MHECHSSTLIIIMYDLMQLIAIANPESQYDPIYMLMLSLVHGVQCVLYYICVWAGGFNAINDELN